MTNNDMLAPVFGAAEGNIPTSVDLNDIFTDFYEGLVFQHGMEWQPGAAQAAPSACTTTIDATTVGYVPNKRLPQEILAGTFPVNAPTPLTPPSFQYHRRGIMPEPDCEAFLPDKSNMEASAAAGGAPAAPIRSETHTSSTGAFRQTSIGLGLTHFYPLNAAAGETHRKRQKMVATRDGDSRDEVVCQAAKGDTPNVPGLGQMTQNDRLTSEQRKSERREQNREHAKRSRIRQKFLLECLQEQLSAERKLNMALRQIVKQHMPAQADAILSRCITEKALALSGQRTESHSGFDHWDGEDDERGPTHEGKVAASGSDAEHNPEPEASCLLMEPDFHLMQALINSQQQYIISDPKMIDNPIVYASQGFLRMTGYSLPDVIGRNCRFLQGPGTDAAAVDIIRHGVEEGRDTSVCLLNYKADGTPFWNQLFVARHSRTTKTRSSSTLVCSAR
uniref:Putative LOV domain-containing protein n=1 Tax=Ishige okamurae TaxID=233772 RepID=A0A126WVP4_9PHAE|nr:putative LOV domain-containing protein [Ishige okamurae]